MTLERLTHWQSEASIPMVQSTIQSTEIPPEVNPLAQSSSSAEATNALINTTGNYIEHI